MKKKLLLTSILSLSLLVTACGGKQEKSHDLSDVSFPETSQESDSRPGSTTLPEVGSDAVSPLELTPSYDYFDNTELQKSLPGQWSGYGVHYPSILRYNGYYYLYVSTPDSNVGIKAYKSKDLLTWNYIDGSGFSLGYITKDRKTYAAKSPRVIPYNDNFYLLFKGTDGNYIFSSDSPEGSFTYVCKLNYASKYNSSIFAAPNGELLFVTGGDNGVSVYKMNSITEVDLTSGRVIFATETAQIGGKSNACDSPSLIDIDGRSYLTYSSVEDDLVSYRSYLVSNNHPNYDNIDELAKGFSNQNQGPILINTNSSNGSRGLGDVSIVMGPNLKSYYAIYTSLETSSVRRLNLCPVSFSGNNLALSFRDHDQIKPNTSVNKLTGDLESGKILSTQTESQFVAEYYFRDMDELIFSYRSENNHYALKFDKENHQAQIVLHENGLTDVIATTTYVGNSHHVIVYAENDLTVSLDGEYVLNHHASTLPLQGKIGFKSEQETAQYSYVAYSNGSRINEIQNSFKDAHEPLYAATYLKEYSSEEVTLKEENNIYSSFYGSQYLELSASRQYVRFLTDVVEDGHYGIELAINGSFTKNSCSLGLRAGLNNEVIYKTTRIADTGFVRTLTAEFNLEKGANELLIENLANFPLRILYARLVKVSSFAPSYQNTLEDYATKGVQYETDFRLDTNYKAHATYEGATSFAYVGNNTITDFKMDIQLAFAGGLTTTGFIGVAFRCDHFASSTKDTTESLMGYYLEVGQFTTTLYKCMYGDSIRLANRNMVNNTNEFKQFRIQMKGNEINIFADGDDLFSLTDAFAFSAGHLGFGASNTNGFIRNLKVGKVN